MDETVDQAEQAGRRRDGAGDVDPGPQCGRRLRTEEAQGGDRGGDREEQVHVHAPAPVQVLGQRPAEDQPDRRAGAGDHAEHAERLVALGGNGEGRGQQAEGRRGQQRGEAALQGAGDDEDLEALGETAECGCDGEPGEAGDEDALAAEEVAEAAAEQQQAAERQRVRGDDPLAGVVGEAQVRLGRGKRDVHDRHVEHDHQLRKANQREDEPAASAVGVGGGGHGPEAPEA